MSSSKRVAKNTLFLYIRMFLILGISLYTTRVVLEELGVSDYGIYNLVGGIVTMIGFFNAAMSTATQRYLAFDLGRNNKVKLQQTFSATLTIHFGIAIIGLLIAETIGLWYINKIMIFPNGKVFAVNVVYQFSILTFLLNIIQVPYNALIIVQERMKIYAYMSVLEVLLKLGTVFILMIVIDNKLVIYSILTFLVSVIIRVLYQLYCRKEFKESRYTYFYDRAYFFELLSYSGWNLFGNIASVAKIQGVNVVLNIFFGTILNASYGLTNQVIGAVNLFVSNLQVAFNPQIIKNYSQGSFIEAQKLIFQGSKIAFLLVLLLVMPILLNTKYILLLWLNEVPEYTVIFVQLALIGVLIESLSGTLMTGAQATGNIKWYQVLVGILIFSNLPISYFALRSGFPPYSIFVISIIVSILSFIVRLIILKKILKLDIKRYFKEVIFRVLFIIGISYIYYIVYVSFTVREENLSSFLLDTFFSIMFLGSVIYYIAMTGHERLFLKNIIKGKMLKYLQKS